MNWKNATFELAYGRSSQIQGSTLPEVVFSGRSNVGKSSLINKLLGRKSLARTSSSPGKTGTINFYKACGVHLVDLPGYGYAKVSREEKLRWAQLVNGYFAQNRRVALVIQLIDMRHAPTKNDLQMLDFLQKNEFPHTVVLTKADKLRKMQREQQLAAIRFENKVIFSSITGEGVDELRAKIETAVQKARRGDGGARASFSGQHT